MSQYGPGDRPATVKVRAKKKTKVRAVKAPAGDVASSGGDYGTTQAKKAAKTPRVQRAVRDTYAEQPAAQREAILKNATGEPGAVVRAEHESRVARNRVLEHAQSQHDVPTAADLAAAHAFNAAHPVKRKQTTADLYLTDPEKLKAAGFKKPGVLDKAAAAPGVALGSAPADIAELVVTTPSSLYKLGATAIHHPEKVPGLLAQPYKDLIKDPGSAVTHPVSTALMFAPAVKVPGRVAGKGLRLAGKQTLRGTPRTLPGTALREEVPRSRDAFVNAAQARAERKAAQRGEKPVMSKKDVERRVDEFYAAAAKRERREVTAQERELSRQGKREGLPRSQRRERVAEARDAVQEAARGRTEQAFAAEFGATRRPAVSAGERDAARGARVEAATQLTRARQEATGAAGRQERAAHDVQVSSARRLGAEMSKPVGARQGVAVLEARMRAPEKTMMGGRSVVARRTVAGRKEAENALGAARSGAQVAREAHIAVKQQRNRRPLVEESAGEGVLFDHKADAGLVARKLNADEQIPGKFVVRRAGDRWTAVPQAAAERLSFHRGVGTSPATMAKVMRVGRQAFTGAVLPSSLKWLLGQGAEAGLRTAVQHGFNPLAVGASTVRARKVVKAMERHEPGSGKALLERSTAGHFEPTGAVREFMEGRKTLAEEFDNTALARPAAAATRAGAAPGVKQLRAGWRGYSNAVLSGVNGFMEQAAQRAMLGKAIKDSPLMERRLIGLSDKAIAEAAQGLRGTATQVQMGRAVRRAYGQYEAFSPELRSLILHWTPFVPWYINSAAFVAKVLPEDHPVQAALIADVDKATEEWRKAHRLSLRGKGPKMPLWLMGSAPGQGNSVTRINQMMPFGAAPGIAEAPGSLALPQFSGLIGAATYGVDWKGQPLKFPGYNGRDFNPGEKALYGVAEQAQAVMPLLGKALKISGVGPRYVERKDIPVLTGETARSALRKELPLQPTKSPQEPGTSEIGRAHV